MKLTTPAQPPVAWLWLTGLGMTAALSLLYILQPLPLQRLEGWGYDVALRFAHQSGAGGQVVVVAIDDASLRTLGRWPWPRDLVARLLTQITQAKPAAVALDLLLAEDGPCAVQCAGYGTIGPDHDAHLAQTMANQPVVLGYSFVFDEALPVCTLPPSRIAWRGENLANALITARAAVCPLTKFTQATRQGGFLNAFTDTDGLFRRIPLALHYQGAAYPALALAAVHTARASPPLLLENKAGRIAGVHLGPQFVPTDAQGNVLLHYRAPQALAQYSATAILDGALPATQLQGKVIFVGLTASGLKDMHTTPVANIMPGVILHATLADNLLAGDTWRTPAWASGGMGLLSLGVGCLITVWAIRLGQRVAWVLGLGLGLILMLGGGSVGLLALQGIWLSPLHPMLTASLCLLSLLWLNFWHSERQRRLLYHTFAHYVAPNVIAELTRADCLPTLQGEDHEITLLFSDIRGFTNLSEQLPAQQLSNLLNRYFTPMTRIVLAHQGTFDKYIGDALMAFWNAPLPVPQHSLQAVRAALEMLETLPSLNAEIKRDYGHSLRIGIAVHAGSARVGNMGSSELFDYTALGANVNLASRIVGLTRHYGVPLLISETVVPAVEDFYHCLEIDQVRVRGLRRAVTLYTPMDQQQATERHLELRGYERARHFYKNGQFAQALRHYTELVRLYPEQGLYATYAKRCSQLLATPPDYWDGIWDYGGY